MSTIQINLSADISRLVAAGYELEIVSGTTAHLLVKNVPYLNSSKEVKFGTLECPLEVDGGGRTINPTGNHQMWFIGEIPFHADGTSMEELMVSENRRIDRGDEIVADMAFSRKRTGGAPYVDYFEKVNAYVRLLWNEARAIDLECTPYTGVRPLIVNLSEVFHYADMATTRSGTGAAAGRLALEKIAIIGLGGTGSYILDLVSKTHVKEIHLFDGDRFESHNAFRAPGAAKASELGVDKVEYFSRVYSSMRKGITPINSYITSESAHLLDGINFAFVSVDAPEARHAIFTALLERNIPFIDVGMGVTALDDGRIRGSLRVTMATPEKSGHLKDRVSFSSGPDNNVYTSDIQVADLNSLNAALAVIRWKKLCGYYQDGWHEHHSTYVIGTNVLSRDEMA